MKIRKPVCVFLLMFIIVQSAMANKGCKPDSVFDRNPHIITNPISPGGISSPDFTLTVNGMLVPVEQIKKFSEAPVNYALLECDPSANLHFELKTTGAIGKYSISPIRKNFLSYKKDHKLKFSLTGPQYIVIQIEGMDDLFLLIDPLDNNSPRLGDVNVKSILDYDGIDASGKINSSVGINKAISDISTGKAHTILYFPPGKYLSKQIDMKSDVSLYLAAGALIEATGDKNDYPNKGIISWDHVHNSKLFGFGLIDSNGRILGKDRSIHIIEANSSEHCSVEDITERDSPFWTNHIYKCNDFNYKNIKVINYRPKTKVNNTDGLNFDCSSNCNLYNGFFYTGDDNCVVKGTDKGSAYNVHNIVFNKYVGYSNSAVCKIGTETTIDSIINITFKNVDVIRCDRALVIDAFDNAKITSVNFQNINIESIAPNGEGSEGSGFIEFIVTNNSWRKSEGRASIKNIMVENVTAWCDLNKFPSNISAMSKTYNISGVVFHNLYAENNLGKMRLVQDINHGNIRIGEFVYNIMFRN